MSLFEAFSLCGSSVELLPNVVDAPVKLVRSVTVCHSVALEDLVVLHLLDHLFVVILSVVVIFIIVEDIIIVIIVIIIVFVLLFHLLFLVFILLLFLVFLVFLLLLLLLRLVFVPLLLALLPPLKADHLLLLLSQGCKVAHSL